MMLITCVSSVRMILLGLIIGSAIYSICVDDEIFQSFIDFFLLTIKQTKIYEDVCADFKLQSSNEYKCSSHQYKIRLIQRSPLIIYIEKFLNQNEIDHLIELAEPNFKPSMVYDEDGKYSQDEHRTSSSTYIKRNQTSLVHCIEKRFADFQGNVPIDHLEQLQVVKYVSEQQFKSHYDWFSHEDQMKNGGQRVTTFFTYLRSNSAMGETEFIDIRFNRTVHQRFCDILNCDKNSHEYGIRFRPLPGNSLFWYNLDEYGQVDYLTYHSGHPPGPNAIKIGLNTWTRMNKYRIIQ